MALPSSPPITLVEIANEFSVPLPATLTECATAAGLSTPVDLLDFLGLSAIAVTVGNMSAFCSYNSNLGGTDCVASYTVQSSDLDIEGAQSYLWENVSGSSMTFDGEPTSTAQFPSIARQGTAAQSPLVGTGRLTVYTGLNQTGDSDSDTFTFTTNHNDLGD